MENGKEKYDLELKDLESKFRESFIMKMKDLQDRVENLITRNRMLRNRPDILDMEIPSRLDLIESLLLVKKELKAISNDFENNKSSSSIKRRMESLISVIDLSVEGAKE